MMFAASMAGMAFNNAGLGYVHSLAHQIGGFYNQTHGVCNAVLLPHVLEFNSESISEDRIFRIGDAMGIKAHNKQDAVNKIMKSIQELSKEICLPTHLKDMGVKKKDIEFLSKNAEKDITATTNPRQGTFKDIMGVYMAAM
jgi:alcohol dehydrogenase